MYLFLNSKFLNIKKIISFKIQINDNNCLNKKQIYIQINNNMFISINYIFFKLNILVVFKILLIFNLYLF